MSDRKNRVKYYKETKENDNRFLKSRFGIKLVTR